MAPIIKLCTVVYYMEQSAIVSMRSLADLWSAAWQHFINVCSVLSICSISPQHNGLTHIQVCCTKMSLLAHFSRLSPFPSLRWSKPTPPSPSTQKDCSKLGAEERAEYAQREPCWPCSMPAGLQHQLHGGDKCTGTSPCAPFCPAEAISHLCYQKLFDSCCAEWQGLKGDLVFKPSMSKAVPLVH